MARKRPKLAKSQKNDMDREKFLREWNENVDRIKRLDARIKQPRDTSKDWREVEETENGVEALHALNVTIKRSLDAVYDMLKHVFGGDV